MKRHIMSVLVVFAAASLVMVHLAGCIGSSTLRAGKKAYSNEDYATALSEFKKAAEEGEAEAQYYLSTMYKEGQGVEKNEAESMKWERMSADAAYAPAQFNLGLRYFIGNQVDQDPAKALELIRKAADQGDAVALYFLGMLSKERSEALKYYKLAKEKGFPIPENLLK